MWGPSGVFIETLWSGQAITNGSITWSTYYKNENITYYGLSQ